MTKAFFLLLTIAFLGVQMLSFAHAAEYGSLEHEHEGTACEICVSTKYQDGSSPGATSEICLLLHAEYVLQLPIGIIMAPNAYEAGITRGPPLFS